MNHEPYVAMNHEPWTMNHEPWTICWPWTINHQLTMNHEPWTMNHEPYVAINHEPRISFESLSLYFLIHRFNDWSQKFKYPIHILFERFELRFVNVAVVMKQIEPIIALICLFERNRHLTQEVRITLCMLTFPNICSNRCSTSVYLLRTYELLIFRILS